MPLHNIPDHAIQNMTYIHASYVLAHIHAHISHNRTYGTKPSRIQGYTHTHEYLPACIPAYPPTLLSAFLPACLPACMLRCCCTIILAYKYLFHLLAHVHVHIRIKYTTYISIHVHARVFRKNRSFSTPIVRLEPRLSSRSSCHVIADTTIKR